MFVLEGGNLIQKEDLTKIFERKNDNGEINILSCNNDINNSRDN